MYIYILYRYTYIYICDLYMIYIWLISILGGSSHQVGHIPRFSRGLAKGLGDLLSGQPHGLERLISPLTRRASAPLWMVPAMVIKTYQNSHTLWLCQNSYWKWWFSSWIFPLKMVDLSIATLNYQRVIVITTVKICWLTVIIITVIIITGKIIVGNYMINWFNSYLSK